MLTIGFHDVQGLDNAIYAMRNPLNSWSKSDSEIVGGEYKLGEQDHKLALKLIKAGSDHAKFLRMIQVWVDITAPLYWWKEFDTYKVGTVANSCSTMHTLHKRPLTVSDFSIDESCEGTREIMEHTVKLLNCYRLQYVEDKDKEAWRSLIQLLPNSYNQTRTVNINYAVLRNIYKARKGHKLSEWQTFRTWCEGLENADFITV